jgi:hypothetical protein
MGSGGKLEHVLSFPEQTVVGISFHNVTDVRKEWIPHYESLHVSSDYSSNQTIYYTLHRNMGVPRCVSAGANSNDPA